MKRGYILPLLSLLFVSCDKGDDLVNSSELANSTPITIEVSQKMITRGELVDTEAKMGSVGLYCAYTEQDDWTTSADYSTRMNNKEFTYGSGKWGTKTPVAWNYKSITDKYSFNAYSPYADNNGITPSIAEGELSIEFTMPEACTDQPDLMIAKPRKNIYPQTGGNVHMEFEHTLAAIGFKLKGKTNMKLLSVTLKGVADNATLTHNGTSCVWSTLTGSNNFEADITQQTATDEATLVTAEKGYILAIPQTPTSATTVYITYCNTDDQTNILNETLPLPASTEWEASHQYRYIITLEESIGLEIGDWTMVNPSDTIKDENGYVIGGYEGTTSPDDTITDENGMVTPGYDHTHDNSDTIITITE